MNRAFGFIGWWQSVNRFISRLLGNDNIYYRFVYIIAGIVVIVSAIGFFTDKSLRNL